MLVIWTIIGAAVIALLFSLLGRPQKKLPPGPLGLPFLGNIFQLDKNGPHRTLTEWSEKYGDVFKIKAFGRHSVVFNSFESIYKAMVTQSDKFAGRAPSYRLQVLLSNCPDIVTSTFSPRWLFMKKMTLKTLKMYGENLGNLEIITLELIDDMLKELKLMSTKDSFDAYPVYHRCVTGIMTSILFGKKLDDATVKTILEDTDRGLLLIQPTGSGVLLDSMPWIRHFPNQLYTAILSVAQSLRHAFGQQIKERKVDYEPGHPKCFNDGLFDHQRKSDQEQADISLPDSAIYGINFNLMIAGTFTTSTTLNCLIAVLVNKPEIQKKMVAEIKAEIGDRTPRLSDRESLHYVEAAILEILRYSSIVPLSVPHCTTVDTTMNGYDIPKDTEVLLNLWKLHHDPEYWDEPWEFRPERYLDEEGHVVKADHINRKRLLAFGASRRVCVGETLAKNRLFLLVTSLLQHFEFLPAGPDELPLHDPRDYKQSFGIEIQRYRVRLVARED